MATEKQHDISVYLNPERKALLDRRSKAGSLARGKFPQVLLEAWLSLDFPPEDAASELFAAADRIKGQSKQPVQPVQPVLTEQEPPQFKPPERKVYRNMIIDLVSPELRELLNDRTSGVELDYDIGACNFPPDISAPMLRELQFWASKIALYLDGEGEMIVTG